MMKIGLGLYRHMLTRDNYQFARQCGCTHIVAHLVDYFHQEPRLPDTDAVNNWGYTLNEGKLWTVDELRALKNEINEAGLELAAIENFDPSHWYDILLDGPKKERQLEDIKTTIRRVGEVGIPVIGYNFSLAGVWGHVSGPWARGGAESVAFLGTQGPKETPIPRGQIWNMTYLEEASEETVPTCSHEELWGRLRDFLEAVLPTAEAAGVRLALHPDDPPMPTLRGYPRLVYKPELYQKLLDLAPSPANGLEFCMGSVQEMNEERMDIYQAIDQYSRQNAIGYIHFRNVKGKVPEYHEVFVDEGDIDMVKALRILKRNGYEGVLIPDHTPQMTCPASWHAGMAYALGYMRAALRWVEEEGGGGEA